jgi:hypothetical protein
MGENEGGRFHFEFKIIWLYTSCRLSGNYFS